jgi:hypothetical protein
MRSRFRDVALVLLVCASLLLSVFGLMVFWRTESKTLSGPVWRGKGPNRDGWTQAQAEQFTDFPLYWLGERFAGFNLYDILGRSGSVVFLHGSCDPGGNFFSEGGCPNPVQLHLRPICTFKPDNPIVRHGEPDEPLRGNALVIRFPLHFEAYLWTGGTSVKLSGNADLLEEAIGQLRGIGPTAALGPGDPLPPPDLSRC